MTFICITLFILHVQSITQTREEMSHFILSYLSNLKRINSVQLQLLILTHFVLVRSVIRLSVALNTHLSINYMRLRQDKIGVRRRQIENLLDCIKITLVYFQFNAQNYYLFLYNTFIKILYMFRASPCSSSGGLRRNCMYENEQGNARNM
jgi:hypothetical protein